MLISLAKGGLCVSVCLLLSIKPPRRAIIPKLGAIADRILSLAGVELIAVVGTDALNPDSVLGLRWRAHDPPGDEGVVGVVTSNRDRRPSV